MDLAIGPGIEALQGATLGTRRKALGLTQAALADVLGVSANTVARWERGDMRIRNPELVHIALERLQARMARRAEVGGATGSSGSDGFPVWPTPLLGREREIQELAAILSEP